MNAPVDSAPFVRQNPTRDGKRAGRIFAGRRASAIIGLLRRSPTFSVGASLFIAIVLVAALAPLVTLYGPSQQDLLHSLTGPSSSHWFGTDDLGRDIWSRVIYGTRIDLRIGIIAVALPFVLGCALGLVAGYFGGWIDSLVMRLVDVVVAFPFLVLIIALVFALGAGERSIYIAMTLVGWVAYARIIRGEVLVARQQEYVIAARVTGLSHARIIARHVFPNVVIQALTYAMSDIVRTVLAVVTLGFLGLGVAPPAPEWGSMIAEGEAYITTNWELATIPGLALVLVGISLSLIGDGLSDLLRIE
jgi:peptide/nickel transport system permease protein